MMIMMMMMMIMNSQSFPAKQSECLYLQVSGSRLHWKKDQVHWTETRVIIMMMMVLNLWCSGKVNVVGGLRIAHFLALFPPPWQGLEFLSPLIHQPLTISRLTKRRRDPDLQKREAAADKFSSGGDSGSWTWSKSRAGGCRS